MIHHFHAHAQTPKPQNTKTLPPVSLKCTALLLFLSSFFSVKGQDRFQLAPPLMRYPSVFFEKETAVALQFAQAGTELHYTTNGQVPTEKDPVYSRPIVLKKHQTTLKVRVFGPGLLPSDPVEATFFKRGLPISNVQHTPPHPSYPGSGPSALVDGKGGIAASDSKTWMGFQQDTVSIALHLAKPEKVKQAFVHALQNQGAWIFLPQKIELWGQAPGAANMVLLGTLDLDKRQKDTHSASHALVVKTEKRLKTDHYLLKIHTLSKIPDWHPGKGKSPWLFLEEVNVY